MLFACSKIGAIFVPLNWRLSLPELDYITKDCAPKLLAFHSQMESLVNGLGTPLKIQINNNEYEDLVRPQQYRTYEQINEEDPFLIIYTGGTTGNPKGVVLSHRAVTWNGINTILSWQLRSEDVTLTYLPMFHTGGLNALSIPILQIGGTVVIGKDFEPNAAIDLLVKEKCTIVLMVPTMYHLILQTDSFKETEFPAMHTFLSGGAPCPLTIYEAFERRGIRFKEGYGLTEAGPNNFYLDPMHANVKKGSVGKPMMFNEIALMDNHGDSVPKAGMVGEIYIKGPHVFSRYWNNDKATNEAFSDGWLRTGDLGRFDEEGFYYIVGRKKEMIITGGENVYPLEVEHIIAQHPAINEAVVVGMSDEKWGEIVTAVVSTNHSLALTLEDLQHFCRGKLASYKIPRKLIVVEHIPKTHVGKIDKKEIMRKFA